MKNLMFAAAITTLATGQLQAGELYAKVTQVEPNYKTVTEYTPIRICREEVPIYGNTKQGQSDAGNVLLEMILGGVREK